MFFTKNIEVILNELNTSLDGLSNQEALRRNAHYGKNTLPEPKKRTIFHIFLEQFKNPIIYILLIAAIISFAIKEFTDAGFIMAVLVINALIGTYQEYSASQQADALKQIVKTYTTVLRDQQKVELLNEDVTVGDIIFFESGNKIPADVRIIKSDNLFVNESLLTGESIDILKDDTYIATDKNVPIGDRKNMLYAGSMITKGRASGVVTTIADQTEVGKLASLLASSKNIKPPLIHRMEEFSLNIAKIIGVVVLLIILAGIYQDFTLKDIFFFTVAVAVSSIPEGLPVAITVALSIATAVMSKRNVIVRKLSAIEGLGSCTLIASDKTGTITQNNLSVENFITLDKEYLKTDSIDQKVLECSILCNEATYHLEEDKLHFLGDQVDVALAQYAIKLDNSLAKLTQSLTPLYTLPYEPENKYSAISYKIAKQKIDFIKGSPEVIIEKCNLSEQELKQLKKQIDNWAGKGFRNIALAYKENSNKNIAENSYTYLGFVAIIDPLREGVIESVSAANGAGIDVVMITGDHPNTAFFIAHELGIAINKDEVIDGNEIAKWEELGAPKEEIAHKRVFARVTPEQKQLIVKTFQDLGHFVAVTGDGVNDAPALKYANIGISMGKSGTDVARESSDLILTDDSFNSIVKGIKEGRVVYDNIRKVVHLLISTGFAEIVLILLSLLFFVPIPLLPVQLLWLNLVTNGIQHVALGFEKAEPDILKRPARDPKEPIFNRIMIQRVIVGGLYMGIMAFIVFYTLLQWGYTQESARNITLLLMVLFENVHVFNSRSETYSIFKIQHDKNKFLILCVIATQLVHIACMYIPFMQEVLKVEPVNFSVWLSLLAIAIVLIGVMEIEKFSRKVQKKIII